MRKLIALFLVLTLGLLYCSTAFAYLYSYGGTIAVDDIATTKHQKKEIGFNAKANVTNKTNWSAKLGYNMWHGSRTHYATFPTIVTNQTDLDIVYRSNYGYVGDFYGLAVKNHVDNTTSIGVTGSWKP